MTYSQSPLASDYAWGTKNSNPRTNATYNPTGQITVITIHHMAAIWTAKQCADYHHSRNYSSANYYIGKNGEILSGVPESRRAWTSGSQKNDYKAITIEVSNCKGSPNWEVSDVCVESTIKLCVDICKRNGIKQLQFTGNANGNLTMHCYFQATACPGPYFKNKFSYIEQEVNRRLGNPEPEKLYRVQVGAFAKKENAEKLAAELTKKGYPTIIVS